MRCKSLKSDKTDWTGANFGSVLWKQCSGQVLIWIKNPNCETIITKMVCKFVSNVFLCTQCCELKVVHQKQFHHFIFWRILTFHTSFSRQLSHNFAFLFKIKIRPLQLGRHCLKSTKPKLASVQSVMLDFNDLHVILMKIVSQIWTCIWNQNLTILARTVTILVCVIEFTRQTEQGGWLIVSFYGGGDCIFTAFYMTVHQKALYQRPWQIRPGLGGHLGKNLNCIKTRPCLANNGYPNILKKKAQS